MIDLDKHVERLERGAECPIDLGNGNTFTLMVRKASIGDGKFYKILDFIEGLSKDTKAVDKIKSESEELTEDEIEEVVGGMRDVLRSKGFAEGLNDLCDYVVTDLACGWEGVTVGDTEEPREFDRDLLTRAFQYNPLLAINVFAFAMNTKNFGDEPEEAEKN